MIDFRKLIKPATLVQMEKISAQMETFSAKDPAEQARDLLDIARRAFACGGYLEDDRRSYDEWALLRVMPEIARRLDPTITLLPREIPRPGEAEQDRITDVRGADREIMNRFARNILAHGSFSKVRNGEQEGQDLWCILSMQREDGIIARAMQSLFPEDWPLPARSVREALSGRWILLAAPEGREVVIDYIEGPDMDASIKDKISEVQRWVEDPMDLKAARIAGRMRYDQDASLYDCIRVQDAKARTIYEERIRPEPSASLEM